jgi:hypothetical protein
MTALALGSLTVESPRDAAAWEEMDRYLRSLDLADAGIRSRLIAENAWQPDEGSPMARLRGLVAIRAAAALGRARPRTACEEAEAILAFVLCGAMRRYPHALIDPEGADARCARYVAPVPALVHPPEMAGAMPVQSLRSASLPRWIVTAWKRLVRVGQALGRRSLRCS